MKRVLGDGEERPRRAQPLAAAVVLALGLVLALVALTRSQDRLAGTNNVPPAQVVATVTPGRTACQRNVLLPQGADAVRVAVAQPPGAAPPPLQLTLQRSGRSLEAGAFKGYAAGYAVVGVRPAPRTTAGEVCVRVDRGRAGLAGAGARSRALTLGGRPVAASLSLQFMRPGEETLLGLAPTVFHRAALFRPGWVGPWTYWVLAALTLLLVGAAPLVLVRWTRRPPRLRTALLTVGLFAFLNAFTWSLVTPAFQPPDEAAHYAYVESLVERGKLPSKERARGETPYTRQTELAVNRIAIGVIQQPAGRPPWSEREEARLRRATDGLGAFAEAGGGGLTAASAYSPLYYGLAAAPYAVAGNGSVFSHIWLIRLLSALMLAGSVALTFLFVRELAPSVAWLAPAAALAVAFEPMVAFIGGAVNNDNLLILLATAELWLLARALRRGLDWRLALGIGAVLGLGICAKPQAYALVPVAALTVGWLLWRARPGARAAALVAGAALVPLAVLTALRYVVSGLPLFSEGLGVEGATLAQGGRGGSPSAIEFLSYLWQWFLPPLGFMANWFAFLGGRPAYEIFLKGFWANFGHLDTQFPGWVYVLLAAFSLAVAAGCAEALRRHRDRLGELWPRVAMPVLAALAVTLLVILRSYLARVENGVVQAFAQGRYLFPAIAVFGLAVAGAGLALGRRWAPVAATAAITAIAVLEAFSLGLVLVRFYV